MEPATPLPWTIGPTPADSGFDTEVFRGRRLVAGTGGYSDGGEHTREDNVTNAAYVVHACNLYPELVATLKKCITSDSTLCFVGQRNVQKHLLKINHTIQKQLAECGEIE